MDYEIVKLNEIADFNKESIGKNSNYDFINYLDTANITNGAIDTIVKMNIEEAPSRAKRIVKKDDIIYSTVRPNLCHYGIIDSPVENMIVSTGFTVISCKDSVNPYYIYNYLTQKDITLRLHSIAENSTSAYPSIKPSDLEDVEIKLPKLEIQNKIAKLLTDIDKKIRVNNEINNNLYEIASSLISEALVNSDKIKLNEIISFVKGKKPLDISEEYKEGYEKYLTIACLNNQENMYADPTKTLLTESDILMVMDGASSGDVYFSDKGIVGSTLSKIEICNEEYIPEYVFFALKRLVKSIQEKTTGSAIPHTDKVFVGNLEIPKLDMEEQLKYKSLIAKTIENNKQNITLSNLRDTLLPKLMNGEIDLDNIEI